MHARHVPPQVGEGARARGLDGAALEATELERVPLALVADLVLHRHQLVQVVIFQKPARSSGTFIMLNDYVMKMGLSKRLRKPFSQ